MTYNQIVKLQKELGIWGLQEQINDGSVWRMEGSMGRSAMHHLEQGSCMLPKVAKYDYYGNRVPARDDLKAGTKGTFKNSQRYYEGVAVF